MNVAVEPLAEPLPVLSPDLNDRSIRLPLQRRVHTQSIWGAFDPRSERLVGVQTSGEAIYQAVANAVVTPTQAGVRTTTGFSAIAVIALGKYALGDGQSGTFGVTSTDSLGNVVTGGISGTTLTIDRIIDGPPITLGLTVSSGVTGEPIGKLIAFGSGFGGTGTYTLDQAALFPDINTFVLDDDGTGFGVAVDNTLSVDTTFITADAAFVGGYLVSPDGTRWVLCR